MAFHMPSFLSRLARPFSTVSLRLQPSDVLSQRLTQSHFPENTQRAVFAGGCFWGIEHLYRKQFGGGNGLLDCRVGYTGGTHESPDYPEVCTGTTGHAEAILILFDPDTVTYPQLVEFFFRVHDPTTLNRQGNDIGTQYRSAIFAVDDNQMKIAQEIKEKVGKEWYPKQTITTQIRMLDKWFDAEDYHQDYIQHKIDAKKSYYECPVHKIRPFPPLSALKTPTQSPTGPQPASPLSNQPPADSPKPSE